MAQAILSVEVDPGSDAPNRQRLAKRLRQKKKMLGEEQHGQNDRFIFFPRKWRENVVHLGAEIAWTWIRFIKCHCDFIENGHQFECMAKTSGCRRNENVKLRRTIKDMVNNIEKVMSNIHVVLGDMGVLVNQIDSITSRLENKYEQKVNKPNILLDANRNQYEVIETPGFSNQSKLPSPFIDYTYLDLADDCEMCGQNVQGFTYNEKYPLWIQCDTWRTGNTGNSPSDLSIVSAGSDDSNALHSGSDGCSQSWKSISNFGPIQTNKCDITNNQKRRNNNSDFRTKLLKKYGECCKSGRGSSDTYCGVYEDMMEAQLDDIGQVDQESCGFDIHDSFSDDLDSDNSITSKTSFSMSDEHIVHYSKVSNTWTAFKLMDVTVREFSDSNTSL